MRSSVLLLIVTVLLFSQCKKDKEDGLHPGATGMIAGHPLDELGLPYATTEGKNTMGCLINGEPWMPLQESFLGPLIFHVPFSLSGSGNLNVQGHRYHDGHNETLHMSCPSVLDEGLFSGSAVNAIVLDDNTSCGFFELDTTYANQIEATVVDFEGEIVSGRFQMRVVNPDCDTLTITEGRFDLSAQ